MYILNLFVMIRLWMAIMGSMLKLSLAAFQIILYAAQSARIHVIQEMQGHHITQMGSAVDHAKFHSHWCRGWGYETPKTENFMQF